MTHDDLMVGGNEFRVGDYARSIETGWLGKIVRIYDDPYQVDRDMPMIACLMAELVGVDFLAQVVGGLTREESLSKDDVQHFALADLAWEK
jgi:hypothetical protein